MILLSDYMFWTYTGIQQQKSDLPTKNNSVMKEMQLGMPFINWLDVK